MVNKIDLLHDGEFAELIKNSSSVADVLRNLGYSIKGNSWAYKIVQERMEKLSITFGKKPEYKNSGINKTLGLTQILTKDSEYNRTKLKERLVKEGIKEYKCEICGLTEWQNKPISLQLHHINGIHNDNRLSNLQLLCPNCHSQTENFGTKGKGLVIQRKCNLLPLEDKKLIIDTVRKKGIVEARKILKYRNSLINAIVKANRDIIIMTSKTGEEKEFSTTVEAAIYICNTLGLNNMESIRSNISNCLSGKQKTCRGYKFERRSARE